MQGRQTPGSRRERERMRDEDCFGGEIDEYEMSKDFDFESNLALFDKKLVFQEIEGEISNQPDVVRLVDCNRKRNTAESTEVTKKLIKGGMPEYTRYPHPGATP